MKSVRHSRGEYRPPYYKSSHTTTRSHQLPSSSSSTYSSPSPTMASQSPSLSTPSPSLLLPPQRPVFSPMEALQRGLSGGCIKQEHSDTVDEEGGGVEEELGGCARTNMPYYHSYLQYSHELAQRGGETVSIRKEEEEEETETQPQDVLQHAPVVYSFECPQQEPQPTRQQASLSWAQPDSNTESTASSTAISSRKRRGHRGKKKKRGMLVDVTSISSPPQLEQHQKRQHLRRQPLHQYVRPSSSSPAPHDKTLRQVILSRGQSGMEKEEEEEEEDDSGDEPYSPKLVIACDTDEECMVEGEEEQDTRQSHERSALSTSQANAQNKRWSQAPERNEEVAVMASSLPSPPPPSCPAVISSPVVRSHSTAHSTAAPARPAPMAVHRLDGFRLDSEQRDALKRLYEWRLRRDVGVIWCHSDVVRLCKKSTDNRRAKVTTVWVNDLQFVRSKPVFKVHRIDARDEEAGNPIEVYPYVSEEEEVDTKPIPIHHQPQVDGQGGLDNLTGQDESPSQEEIEVAQDSATEQHQTQSMVRAKGKEKEKGKDTGGQRTEGVCVVFDDIDQRSGSDLFDLELITAADEGSSDNLIQKPSTAPGSSGQQVSTRKRLHSEEREKKQLKRQRVDKDVGSSGLPEQVDGTHSDGPQLPVEADSVLSSPPAPHHSIAPYQQPLKEKSDGTKSSDQGDKPSHEQQPSITQKIPKAFLAYGIPSRIASIIQSYWYVRGRQKVVEKKMSEQK